MCINWENRKVFERFDIKLQMAELQDSLTMKETEAAELSNRIDDLQYELMKVQTRNDKLEHHLAEAIEKVKTYQQIHGDEKGTVKPVVTTTVSQKKVNQKCYFTY